jgi:hypothetical protein
MSWLQKLQTRWKVDSAYQVFIILLVFACTGFTVLFIKRPLFNSWFGAETLPTWASVVYYILVLPIYNAILLFYGFLIGQFNFFWDFEKRFFNRIVSIFKPQKNKQP